MTTSQLLSIPERTRKAEEFDHEGWNFCSVTDSIASAEKVDEMTQDLGFAAPTMLFDKNSLSISFSGKLIIQFTAFEALKRVRMEAPSFNVSSSDEWKKARIESHADIINRKLSEYDWTYCSEYSGSFGDGIRWEPIAKDGVAISSTEGIDYDMLKRPDPIKFYAENLLYEDELADNGLCKFSVKVRVMPGCFFILKRYALCVENVVCRCIDTRFFHKFGTSTIAKETKWCEDKFSEISNQNLGEKILDLDWIATKLAVKHVETFKAHLNNFT